MSEDMREALNAALDSTAEDDDTQNYDETEQVIDATEETAEAQAGEEEGTSVTDALDAEETADSGDDKSDDAPVEPKEGSGNSIKAPIDWGPQDREAWSKIPRHLQEKVMSREKELNTMMQTTADARKTHTEFEQLSNKYGSVLSGVIGDTPMEAVGNLFNTVSNLRMGSPIQKAQIIADMIGDFGVDVNTLDSALVGAAPTQEQTQHSQYESMLNERLAPFEQMMGQQNAYQKQQDNQRQEAAVNEVRAFADGHEFLADVREDMADMIDMATSRGATMTIEDAYKKACMLNPQIQSVITKREQQAQLTSNSNTMAGKRLAASSITGGKGGIGGGNGSGSLRDTLSAAWDGQDKI